jgi:hypothetical protein
MLFDIKPMHWIFVGGAITVLGTALTIYATLEHNKASSQKSSDILNVSKVTNKEVIDLRKQNDSLRATSGLQLNKIDELRQENTRLNLELRESTREIYNSMTGDGNSPTLIMMDVGYNVDPKGVIPDYFRIQFLVKNEGKYPLRSLTVNIVDFAGKAMLQYGVSHYVDGELTIVGHRNEKEIYSYKPKRSFPLEALSPNVEKRIYQTTYAPSLTKGVIYDIGVNWENGYYQYMIGIDAKGDSLSIKHIETRFNGEKIKKPDNFKFITGR